MRLGGFSPLGHFPPPDAFFCTSLLDVAVARTQVEAKIGRRVPTVLYMHENQVEYPDDPEREADQRDVHFALTNLNSIFAADLVIWNSRWNLESFLAGLGQILHPCRGIPFDDLEERIRARSNVAWCPVEVPSPELPCPIEPSDVPLVVWPHRHEHDKGPDLCLNLQDLTGTSPFDGLCWASGLIVSLMAMKRFRQEFADSIVFDDYPNRRIYESIIGTADWVCSTARHEFFGLSVVEAMFAGCMPWVPAGLSYRELLPAAARGLSPAAPPEELGCGH